MSHHEKSHNDGSEGGHWPHPALIEMLKELFAGKLFAAKRGARH